MSSVACHVSHVPCHMTQDMWHLYKKVLNIKCHVSQDASNVPPVTCHMSPQPSARATDPPPAYSPIAHNWLVSQTPKPKNQRDKILETQKFAQTFQERRGS